MRCTSSIANPSYEISQVLTVFMFMTWRMAGYSPEMLLAQVTCRAGDIEQLQTLQLELTRMTNTCAGGIAADCRVVEVLADHGMCDGEH
jgi:hypothetical protein